MLDFKIHTFLTLCKYMNYRITATHLNMTQPAVTQHIKQLEHEYNCRLFIYQNRTLYKTKQAEILEAYSISASFNEKKLALSLNNKETMQLNIGATRTIGDYISNKQIISILNNENLDINYIVDNTENLIKMLKNAKLDFVLIEGFINKNNFAHHIYKSEKLVGICSTSHPFSGKTIPFEDIFNNRIILREVGSGTRDAFERILTDNNCTVDNFKSKFQTNSFKTIIDLVSSDMGISFVYESIFNNSVNIGKFEVNGINSLHNFTCVYLKDTEPSEFLKYFISG